jgi:competence protein ComEC
LTARDLWRLLAVWCAGLAAGAWIPPLLRLPGLLLALGLLHPVRSPRTRRAGGLLLIGLAASLVGALVFAGPHGQSGPLPSGRRNPDFRPLPLQVGARPESSPRPALVAAPPAGQDPLRSLEAAVLAGRREGLPPDWRIAFRAAGVAHLLAISGLHLGILTGLLLGLLRLLCLPRPAAALLTAVALAVYVAAVGAPPSALRAGLMTALGLLLWGSGRHPPAGSLLPAALLLLLGTAPALLASPGFLLSASATGGIVLALRGFDARLLERAPGRLEAFLRVSLGAQAGVLPAQILFFGTLHPLGWVVNLGAVPLAGLWLPAALAARAAELLGGWPAAVARAWSDGLGDALVNWVIAASRLPGACVPAPGWAALAALVGLLAWARGGRGRIAAIGLLALIVWSPLLDSGRPRIVFLDVGQGDAVVIETRRPRRTVVVDTGPAWGSYDSGREVVLPYLRARGVQRIDLLVLSHPDSDHLGGAAALVGRLPVGAVVRGDWPGAPTGAVAVLERAAAVTGTPVRTLRAGDVLTLAERARLEVLAGADGFSSPGWNDRSLVLRCVLEGLRVLLPGDLEHTGEARLRPWWGYLEAEVLKVAHHGSPDATSARFLAAVDPALAVVSVGRGNRFGHPDEGLMARLEASGVSVLRTDRGGAVVLVPATPFTRLAWSVAGPILTACEADSQEPGRPGQWVTRSGY